MDSAPPSYLLPPTSYPLWEYSHGVLCMYVEIFYKQNSIFLRLSAASILHISVCRDECPLGWAYVQMDALREPSRQRAVPCEGAEQMAEIEEPKKCEFSETGLCSFYYKVQGGC